MAAEAPSSSSSRSNVDHHGSSDVDKALTESELVAAEQLMQLSDNSSSSCGSKKRRSYKGEEEYETDEEGVVEYQSPLSVITCAKIEEIFGKEEDLRPKKKRTTKYRSLADIYSRTKPIRR